MNTSTSEKTRIPNKVRRRNARKEAQEATRERGEVKAIARYVKIAPRKARLVVDTIRGKSATEAIDILRFTNKRSSSVIEKVLQSAVANAESNFALDTGNLYVYQAYVDEGPAMRRFRARAMGRAAQFKRRTSHITIVVKERGEGK